MTLFKYIIFMHTYNVRRYVCILSVYIYVHMCMYVCMYLCMNVCIFARYVCMYMRVHMYMFVFVLHILCICTFSIIYEYRGRLPI